jgi:hypothetical protein
MMIDENLLVFHKARVHTGIPTLFPIRPNHAIVAVDETVIAGLYTVFSNPEEAANYKA